MSDDTQWTLLLRPEDGAPKSFCTIHRCGSWLAVRQGRVKTFGAGPTVTMPTAEAARQRVVELVEEKRGEGFAVARTSGCDPAAFDYQLLVEDIVEGARRAFEAVRAARSDERIDAYALYSDGGAMTIVCAADSTEARGGAGDERRWCCQEWPYVGEGSEHLEVAYRRILTLHDGPLKPPAGFEDRVFDACLRALERLDGEGFFGVGAERERALVTFEPYAGSDPLDAIQRLNPEAVYATYLALRSQD